MISTKSNPFKAPTHLQALPHLHSAQVLILRQFSVDQSSSIVYRRTWVMVWYHLYTDITPPPFIWLLHDFLLILKVKNSVTFNSFFSISPERSKGGKSFSPSNFLLHISTLEGATIQQEKSNKNQN